MKDFNAVNEFIDDMGYEDVLIFSSPDYASAFIGVDAHTNRAVYDYEKMVQHLMDVDDMDELEAIEFIDYNTFGSMPAGDGLYPIVVMTA